MSLHCKLRSYLSLEYIEEWMSANKLFIIILSVLVNIWWIIKLLFVEFLLFVSLWKCSKNRSPCNVVKLLSPFCSLFEENVKSFISCKYLISRAATDNSWFLHQFVREDKVHFFFMHSVFVKYCWILGTAVYFFNNIVSSKNI